MKRWLADRAIVQAFRHADQDTLTDLWWVLSIAFLFASVLLIAWGAWSR